MDEEEEDDIHFCIRCKRSIHGLDNYVNHRKQTCTKLHNAKSKENNPESDEGSAAGKSCSNNPEVEVNAQKHPAWNESLDKNFRQSGSTDVLGPFMPSNSYLEHERGNVNRFSSFETDSKTVNDRDHVTSRMTTFSDNPKAFGKDEKDEVVSTSSIAAPSDHFSRFDEPLFHSDAAVSSFFKSFDSFVDGRFQSLTDHQMLFSHKETADSYESTSHDMEQRYSDLYGGFGGHTSQDMEQSVKGSNTRLAVNRTSKDSADPEVVKPIDIQDSAAIPGLHVDLKQDDFLSSLDLSSVKLLHDKRKYSYEDEEEDDEDDDQHRPPTHHTGGKWRPGMLPPPSTVAGKWRPFSPTSQDRTDYDDEGDSTISNVELTESIVRERKPRVPTKGKWLPGKRPRGSKNSTLRCDSCEIDFSSKSSFRRHMNIHDLAAKNDKLVHQERPSRAKKLLAKAMLRKTISNWKKKKPIGVSEPILLTENQLAMPEGDLDQQVTKSVSPVDDQSPYVALGAASTVEKSLKIKCPVCRLSFGAAYLSNHFASLAHIHNELEYKEGSGKEAIEEQNKILLANVDTLISICHFRCSDCKFYCNLKEDLYRHMASHQQPHEQSNNFQIKFTCSACPDDDKMSHTDILHHLTTPAHTMASKDKILNAKNIVISSHCTIPCSLCGESFKFYRQYEDHRRKHHRQSEFKLSSRTPRLCPMCNFQGHSCKQVRSHIRTSHDIMPHYICYLCGTMHETSEQAKIHRFSRSHRLKAGKDDDGAKHCRFCYTSFVSLQKLRVHLEVEHITHLTPCVKCGFIPILQSDLRVHQKSCTGIILEQYRNFEHRCELCPFSSHLAAHVMLHTTVIHGGNAPDSDTFVCHVCQKSLKSTSLSRHMLFHTREFTHRCGVCTRSFPVKDWLDKHTDVAHANASAGALKLLCQHCGLTFSSRTLLAQHQATSQCNPAKKELLQKRIRTRTSQRFSRNAEPSSNDSAGHVCEICGEICQTDWALRNHIRGHRSPNQLVRCPDCTYTTRNLAHLRRHRRTHSGVRPFRCPHCNYTANNQENLRRHMKTRKHPGRYLYECEFCQRELGSTLPNTGNSRRLENKDHQGEEETSASYAPPPGVFVTDLAVEFRKHLEENHLSQFDHMDEITRHVRSYYRPEEDVLECWETEASVQDEDEPAICSDSNVHETRRRKTQSMHPSEPRAMKKNMSPLLEKIRNPKAKKLSKLKKGKANNNMEVDLDCSENKGLAVSKTNEEQFIDTDLAGSIVSVSSVKTSQYCERSEIPASDNHATQVNVTSSYSAGVSTLANCYVPQAHPILVPVNPIQKIQRGPAVISSSSGSSIGVSAHQSGSTVVLPTVAYHHTLVNSSDSTAPGPFPPQSLTSDASTLPAVNNTPFLMTRIIQPQILPMPGSTGLPVCSPVVPVPLQPTVQPQLMQASSLPKAELHQIISPSSLRIEPYSSSAVSQTFPTTHFVSHPCSSTTELAYPTPLVQQVLSPTIRPRFTGGTIGPGSPLNSFVPTTFVPPQAALLIQPLATSNQSEVSSTIPLIPPSMVSTRVFNGTSQSSDVNTSFSSTNFEFPSNCNKQSRCHTSSVDMPRNVQAPDRAEVPLLVSSFTHSKSDANVDRTDNVDNSRSVTRNKSSDATDTKDDSNFAEASGSHGSVNSTSASFPTFTALIPADGCKPITGGKTLSILCKKVRLPKRTK